MVSYLSLFSSCVEKCKKNIVNTSSLILKTITPSSCLAPYIFLLCGCLMGLSPSKISSICDSDAIQMHFLGPGLHGQTTEQCLLPASDSESSLWHMQGSHLLPGILRILGRGQWEATQILSWISWKRRAAVSKEKEMRGRDWERLQTFFPYLIRPIFRMMPNKSPQARFCPEIPWSCNEVMTTFVTYALSLCLTCPHG